MTGQQDRRIVIGGTDVTAHIQAGIAAAPRLNEAQRALIRQIFGAARADTRPRPALQQAA